MQLFKNRYFLLGNLLLIILAIPLTLFLVRRLQVLRGSAAPTTTLAIEPNTVTANTCQNPITMDVFVDPDKNLVSIVDMYVVYDATKLELTKINPNKTSFPLTLRGPNYASGKANISLSIGSDVTRAIQQKTKVATLEFKPLAATSGGPVTVSLDKAQTRVFSLSKTDEAGENVLLNTLDTAVTINTQANCPAVSPGVTGTATPSATITTAVTPTAPLPTTPPLVNQAPVCTSLNIDRATNGTAPYSLAFTGNGTDANGTITKVTFNFGDGPVQEVTTGGGFGTKTVSLQASHTYNNAGTYEATVSFTDNDGAVSSPSAACSKTITVAAAPAGGNAGVGGNNGGSAGGGAGQPTPTLESPGSVLQTVGIVGGIMIALAGGFFLLML
jgi:hypothetical protein